MTWKKCVEIIANRLNKTFSDPCIENLSYSYESWSDEQRLNYSKTLKEQISDRLLFIFKYLSNKQISGIFKDVSELEIDFFICLLDKMPRRSGNPSKEGNIDIYKKVPNDYWEYLSVKTRREILKHIKKLNDENNTIYKYMYIGFNDNFENVFSLLVLRILYPQYYRLRENINQLNHLISIGYDCILEKMGEENFLKFEKDLDNLLRSYDNDPNSPIRGYPRNTLEINEEIKAFCNLDITESDFKNQIFKALNN